MLHLDVSLESEESVLGDGGGGDGADVQNFVGLFNDFSEGGEHVNGLFC